MSVESVDVVRGKCVVRVSVAELLAQAAAAARVVVDLGAGDGRYAYRLARAHPAWLCLAVDACAAGMRELSWRAGRKPSRGGAPNAIFVRAEASSLPEALCGIADEVSVFYPWGSLLRAVLEPEPALLARIVRLGRPGAALRIRVNESALAAAGTQPLERWLPRLRHAYSAAGVNLALCGPVPAAGLTRWGTRLLAGRAAEDLAIEGALPTG